MRMWKTLSSFFSFWVFFFLFASFLLLVHFWTFLCILLWVNFVVLACGLSFSLARALACVVAAHYWHMSFTFWGYYFIKLFDAGLQYDFKNKFHTCTNWGWSFKPCYYLHIFMREGTHSIKYLHHTCGIIWDLNKKNQLCHVMAGNQIPSQKLGGGHVLDFSLSSL